MAQIPGFGSFSAADFDAQLKAIIARETLAQKSAESALEQAGKFRIARMQNDIAQQQLGLARQRVASQSSLAERGLGIDEERLELARQRFASQSSLSERGLGIDEERLGLARQQFVSQSGLAERGLGIDEERLAVQRQQLGLQERAEERLTATADIERDAAAQRLARLQEQDAALDRVAEQAQGLHGPFQVGQTALDVALSGNARAQLLLGPEIQSLAEKRAAIERSRSEAKAADARASALLGEERRKQRFFEEPVFGTGGSPAIDGTADTGPKTQFDLFVDSQFSLFPDLSDEDRAILRPSIEANVRMAGADNPGMLTGLIQNTVRTFRSAKSVQRADESLEIQSSVSRVDSVIKDESPTNQSLDRLLENADFTEIESALASILKKPDEEISQEEKEQIKSILKGHLELFRETDKRRDLEESAELEKDRRKSPEARPGAQAPTTAFPSLSRFLSPGKTASEKDLAAFSRLRKLLDIPESGPLSLEAELIRNIRNRPEGD